jgi:predicted ester cyclase
MLASAERIKSFVSETLVQIINEHRAELIPQVVADTFVFRTIPGLPHGPMAFRMSIEMYQRAFPDVQVTIDDVIAEGDKVVVRQTFRGTHEGPMGSVAPTGRAVTFAGIFIFRVEDEKFVEEWAILDGLGLQNQLGQPLYFQARS